MDNFVAQQLMLKDLNYRASQVKRRCFSFQITFQDLNGTSYSFENKNLCIQIQVCDTFSHPHPARAKDCHSFTKLYEPVIFKGSKVGTHLEQQSAAQGWSPAAKTSLSSTAIPCINKFLATNISILPTKQESSWVTRTKEKLNVHTSAWCIAQTVYISHA